MSRYYRPHGAHRRRTRSGTLVLALCGLLVAVVCSGITVRPVVAQQNAAGWSPPEAIARTDGTLAAGTMALVPDATGRLHLFYCHQPAEDAVGSIDYARWEGSQWSQPVDVLIDSPTFSPVFVQAAIDPQEVVHLVWVGDNSTLKHASAPVAEAGSARAWSTPRAIAAARGAPDLIAAPDGTLYVAYADQPSLQLLISSSSDGGASWSDLAVVAASAPGTALGEPSVAMDGAGRLHATWTGHTLPSGELLAGVFYSRSADGGNTWEVPRQIDGERHGELGVSAVGDDEIHLVWRSSLGADGTFHQWSTDGGVTWSLPDVYNDGGGISGMPSFATDSAGVLHYTIGPAFVTSWDQRTLQSYVDVAGERLRTSTEDTPGWSPPERAVIAVTLGNELHVVFATSFRELWHTWKRTEAAAVPPAPLPAANHLDNLVTEAESHPTPTAVDGPTPDVGVPTPLPPPERTLGDNGAVLSFLLAFIPAALIVSIVVIVRILLARKG